jgi:hypothetical protein
VTELDDRSAVLVQTRYDRFPATVKGAFVLRGGDANPHLVRVVRATIQPVSEGEAKDIAMGHVDVDVAPGRDLFVPFEAGIAELDPGWYVIAAEMQVDGSILLESASRPFSVAWPRGEVRTGSVSVDESVRVGEASLHVDRAELKSDRVILVWKPEGAPQGAHEESGVEVRVEVSADGRTLAEVPRAPGSEPKPGEHRSVHYPAPHGAAAPALVYVSPAGDRSEIVRAPIG